MSWFKKHIGSLLGSFLLPGIGTFLGHQYDKQTQNQNLLKKSNQSADVANYLTLKQQEAEKQAIEDAKNESLQQRKNTIDAQRKQLINNKKSYYSSNGLNSKNFSLLDNDKTLG